MYWIPVARIRKSYTSNHLVIGVCICPVVLVFVPSQEEIHLEETEEEVRAVLDSETRPQDNDHRAAESFYDLRADAAEELISGDADDPPLSQQTIAEMLNASAAIHVPPRVL